MTAAETRSESGTVARHIAQIAARLFATQGYDATPVRAIVEAAGVTKPTLYYHFGSKEGLAQALLTVPITQLVESLRAILEDPGDPVDKLVAMTEARFAFCREDPDRARFLYALFFGPLGSSLAGEIALCSEEMTSLDEQSVQRLAEAGIIDADRAHACFLAVKGMTVIYTMAFLYHDGPLGPELARQIVDDLLRGFGRAEAGRGCSQ